MQNEAVYSDLTKVILTRKDANILLMEVSWLKETLFKTDPNVFAGVLKEKVRKKVSDIIENYISRGDDRGKLLELIEKKFRAAESIELVVAFEPTQSSLEKISNWVKMNIAPVLIDYKLDKRLLGGAIVTYKGKISDGSLLKKFHEIKD